MKYQARIIKLDPAEPGLYYPTFEYCDADGKVMQITSSNTTVVNHWDIEKTHTIRIHDDGTITLTHPNSKIRLGGVIAVIMAMILLPLLFGEKIMGLFFIGFALAPLIIGIQHIRSIIYRNRLVQSHEPHTGKIVWYHETIRRHDEVRSIQYYPILEYTYNGKVMSIVLPEYEQPVHTGEYREFYIDEKHQTIFTHKTTRQRSILPGVVAILLSIPFLCVGIMTLLPDNMRDTIYDTLINGWNNSIGTSFQDYSWVMWLALVLFTLPLVILIYKEMRQVRDARYAKMHGTPVTANQISTNQYGSTRVWMYEYTYQGQLCQYQSQTHTEQTITLYLHPQTQQVYSERDITLKYVEVGLVGGFVALMWIAVFVFTRIRI